MQVNVEPAAVETARERLAAAHDAHMAAPTVATWLWALLCEHALFWERGEKGEAFLIKLVIYRNWGLLDSDICQPTKGNKP